MIKSFEKETAELNDYEKNHLLPIVVEKLSLAVGKSNSIKSHYIVDEIKIRGFKVDSARIRKVVHEIRAKGLIKNLMATSNGYYIATSKKDIEVYIQSLRQREDSIRQIRTALIKQSQDLC